MYDVTSYLQVKILPLHHLLLHGFLLYVTVTIVNDRTYQIIVRVNPSDSKVYECTGNDDPKTFRNPTKSGHKSVNHSCSKDLDQTSEF